MKKYIVNFTRLKEARLLFGVAFMISSVKWMKSNVKQEFLKIRFCFRCTAAYGANKGYRERADLHRRTKRASLSNKTFLQRQVDQY